MALQAKGLLKVCINFYSCRPKSSVGKYKAFEFNRKARFIAKLFAENAAERKQWSRGLPTHKVYGASSLSPKRLETLNRIFLSNITDVLTTSTRSDELAELGLLVNRAELSKCGHSLHVMWSTSVPEFDEKAASVLEECKRELRDNIVTKSVGGFIPQIIFKKDVNATAARDVEYILSLPSVVKDLEIELPKQEDAEVAEKDADQFEVKISTDILGLKRGDILRRVMVTAKRLQKEERERKEEKENEDNNEMSEEIPDRLANIDVRKQKAAISAFIRKQNKTEHEKFIATLENTRFNVSEDSTEDEYHEDEYHEDEYQDVDEQKDYYEYMDSQKSSFNETDLESSDEPPTP